MASVKVARTEEVPIGKGKVVKAAGRALALFNIGGKFYAVDNRCTHVGGPLGEGAVAGNVVTCPWHGSRFDVTTGQVIEPPARRPVRTFPVKVVEGAIYVEVPGS
ncbi:MAG TPA: non-heme iron oxygenase ferredoxin subunit [bacterium]|nr:non-heme iron oxygenase ferredoxin subunit [bacterium]